MKTLSSEENERGENEDERRREERTSAHDGEYAGDGDFKRERTARHDEGHVRLNNGGHAQGGVGRASGL